MKILIMLIPIILLVIVAFISRNLFFSMICAALLAVVIECKGTFFTGFSVQTCKFIKKIDVFDMASRRNCIY